MNIETELEKEHSRTQTDKIVSYVGYDNVRFEELMTVVLANKKGIAQRAAWSMAIIALQHPMLFVPYLGRILMLIQQKNVHDSLIRNSLKTFEAIEIPENCQGEIVELCLKMLLEPSKPVAIKAFAISTLQNICRQHPELAIEVKLILKERIEFEKPAFISRAKRFLKEF